MEPVSDDATTQLPQSPSGGEGALREARPRVHRQAADDGDCRHLSVSRRVLFALTVFFNPNAFIS